MFNKGVFHTPALLKETSAFLRVKSEGKYIDATLGGGGHSEEIINSGGRLLAIDQDPDAIENAKIRFSACPGGYQMVPSPERYRLVPPTSPSRVVIVKGNFAKIEEIAKENDFTKVDGILFDLGVSSHQLETAKRGFSFNLEGPLDMRMDPELFVTAKDLIKALSEKELEELFSKLGEEKFARRFARAVCRAREIKMIETCNELAEIIVKSAPPRGKFDRTHPATKIFQALRIAVNDELNALRKALPQAVNLLNPNGRILVISFHSLEDGIVKKFFAEKEKEGLLKIITEKPVEPTKEEVEINLRARSAKLRVAEKLI